METLRRRHIALAAILVLLAASDGVAADWPLWRHDGQRSGASPEVLSAKLHLQWSRTLPALQPAWPDQPKMQLDANYEPIVLGHLLIVPSSRNDTVTAYDTRTGVEVWCFHTDGPVRFAPAGWEGKVYFAADDGYLYCLDADKGTLLWKFRGGPADRKILGNGRLISMWPARGAPVIADGTVYFAASIWPFMGIFIHALDAKTGAVVWTNSGDGSIYMKQPHNSDSFASVAPQGPLVVVGDVLLLPGGRSVPACYDRRTGKMMRYQLAENSKRGGGSEVVACSTAFFNGGAAFDLGNEKYFGDFSKFVVLTEDQLFGFVKDECRSYELQSCALQTIEEIDRKGDKVKTTKWALKEIGSVKTPALTALSYAGGRLYAGVKGKVLVIRPPSKVTSGEVVAELEVPGTPTSLLVADDRLFVVTQEAGIHCFGADDVRAASFGKTPPPVVKEDKETAEVHAILDAAGTSDGYCLVCGIHSEHFVVELVRQSKLQVIVLDTRPERVAKLREVLIAHGSYGERASALVVNPATMDLPPYLASLIVVADPEKTGVSSQGSGVKVEGSGVSSQPHLDVNGDLLRKLFHSLRPYGGTAWLAASGDDKDHLRQAIRTLDLPGAKVKDTDDALLLCRAGPLPGSANWTHEHADPANTRVSHDTLVRAPLGILWWGGTSNDGILPRHGHGPQPQVLDGRLIIEGVDMIRATDIYTGRLLWETSVPGVGAFYNTLAHQPGANASGTNFIATTDGIYVVSGKTCLRLDPITGKKLAEFKLPAVANGAGAPLWGYINVCGDYLIAGADPLFDPKLFKPLFDPKLTDDDKKKDDKKPDDDKKPEDKKPEDKPGVLSKFIKGADNDNLSSSRHLVVMDRHSGEVLWSISAECGFRHNAICAGGGRLYCIDRYSGLELARMRRRGEEPSISPRLSVFELKTGKKVWTTDTDVFGTWLSYSEKHDILIEAGRVARDTIIDEPKGMRAYAADTGKVFWHNKTYTGPAMIHGDIILRDQAACDIHTGQPVMRKDPLTDLSAEWTWIRNYGCNTPAASENLLTFRSGAAGYFDLAGDGGTGNLGGFRSSCTNNLIVADGLLNVPDYTRTCTCSYQNQTSLALIYMPDAEMWTSFGTTDIKGPIKRVGINFGAPGDRKADDGTLWLEYPSVGGKSPNVGVTLNADKPQWFRMHSALVAGEGIKWVTASGVQGVKSVTIALDSQQGAERSFTVRLYFLEPDSLKPGQRVFNVALQGKEVLANLDIVREAGGANRGLVKEFRGVKTRKDITLSFTPDAKCDIPVSLICGIEIVVEPK